MVRLHFSKPSIDTLESDFLLSFSFSGLWGHIVGRWIKEVCIMSALREMLFPSHSPHVTANTNMNAYFSMPKALNF